MLPRVAAVTMAYNEGRFLPIWSRHYARQVGADSCIVVDHGSSEDVPLPRGMNRLRLPRSAHDDTLRAGFISTLARGLLAYYDWVLYTDSDELLVADPDAYPDLLSFCQSRPVKTLTAVGFDVQQVPLFEAALDPAAKVGPQRQWARFTSAMCKPLLTAQPIHWSAGFHASEHPTVFDDLYLFHLHWADEAIGLERLQKTRRMPWGAGGAGDHQRFMDAEWLGMFRGMADLPRRDVAWDRRAAPLGDLLRQTTDSRAARSGQAIDIDLSIGAGALWPIPERFRAALG